MPQLVRRDLECLDTEVVEQVDRLVVEGCRQEVEAAVGRVPHQRLVPLARQLELGEQLRHRLTRRQDAVEVGRARRRLGHDRIGPERLELDGVGAGLGGHVDQPARLVQVAIVIGACLRDDVDRGAGTHRPVADPHDVHQRPSADWATCDGFWTTAALIRARAGSAAMIDSSSSRRTGGPWPNRSASARASSRSSGVSTV